jgi:hypothetical protein
MSVKTRDGVKVQKAFIKTEQCVMECSACHLVVTADFGGPKLFVSRNRGLTSRRRRECLLLCVVPVVAPAMG